MRRREFILSSGEVQNALGGLLGIGFASAKGRIQSCTMNFQARVSRRKRTPRSSFRSSMIFRESKAKFSAGGRTVKGWCRGVCGSVRGISARPTSTSEHPDEILGDVFGVVAVARGFSDDGLRRIARCIMMELCR